MFYGHSRISLVILYVPLAEKNSIWIPPRPLSYLISGPCLPSSVRDEFNLIEWTLNTTRG